ncbi:MAG: glycosyltransferase family 2 protein [Anaerolineae bacterium]|nr:glycosyltransferase family 2 protein [Anaerolineae bacterium]
MANILSIVVPAYNEEDGVAAVIERTLAVEPELRKVGLDGMELIIVDDGSKDRTAEIVKNYIDRGVVLIQHKKNRNYGGAIKTGFKHARGNLLAFMDADGTYPPEYYPKMVQALFEHNADLVIGSRMAGVESEMPLTRRIGNTLFAGLVTIIGNIRITDSASGQRILKREVLEKLYPLPDGLNFTPVMSTRALHEDLKMIEVPIKYEERAGESKLSVVRDGFRFLFTILSTAAQYNPVRLLGALSILSILLGVLALLPWLLAVNSGVQDRSAYTYLLFAAMTFAIAAVNLFSVGTAFNYVVSLFYRRSIRQGLFGRPIFGKPMEMKFGTIGMIFLVIGAVLFLAALIVSPGEPLWFLLVPSAMFAITGIQLGTCWMLIKMLAQLSQRESLAAGDLVANDEAAENAVVIRRTNEVQKVASEINKAFT